MTYEWRTHEETLDRLKEFIYIKEESPKRVVGIVRMLSGVSTDLWEAVDYRYPQDHRVGIFLDLDIACKALEEVVLTKEKGEQT